MENRNAHTFAVFGSVLAVCAAVIDPTQGAGFCPPPNISINGFCQPPGFPVQPGYSVAALSSQSLSGVSQSVTQQTTDSTLEAVRRRKDREARRESSGPLPYASPVTSGAPWETILISPSQSALGPSWAVWTQAFYERETRTNLTRSDLLPLGPNGFQTPALGSIVKTTGTLGGADITSRGVIAANDILLFGFLASYTTSTVSITNTSTPAAFQGTQTSATSAKIRGPSFGVYAAYSTGLLTADMTMKLDRFRLRETFTEDVPQPGNAPPLTTSGMAEVPLTNKIIAGNLSARIPTPIWVEPTAGFRYTRVIYGEGAADLGLGSGHIWRLQGGARFGADFDVWGVRVAPVLTQLAYSDVEITTKAILLLDTVDRTLSEEGKVRGQTIAALNVGFSPNLSGFLQGDLRYGRDMHARGGKVGVRLQW